MNSFSALLSEYETLKSSALRLSSLIRGFLRLLLKSSHGKTSAVRAEKNMRLMKRTKPGSF